MRWSDDLDPALLARMAAQGGVFTSEQAQTHGHSAGDLQRLRRRRPRVLTSVRRGVYAWREVWESADATARHRIEVAAAVLRLADDAVVSHHSAAVVHGLSMLDPDLRLVHVTRAPTARPHTEAGIHHHVAELPAAQVVTHPSGPQVSSIARTAVDIARATSRLECAVAACDSALRAGATREQLREVFELCRTWPGARHVARAIRLADGRADNPGESWSRVVLIQQGVPAFDLQVPAYDEGGLIGYADFGWPGVLGEFDGKGKYGLGDSEPDPVQAAQALWAEKRREDRLRVRNEVVRWTVADLHQPAALGARVRAALAQAARRFGPPVGRAG